MENANKIIVDFENLPEIVSINLPFFVNEKKIATDLLGVDFKEDILNKRDIAVTLNSSVHSIVKGTRIPHHGLLLKIKRNKKSKEVSSVSAIGRVASQYNFDTPSSFKVCIQL